MIMLHQQKPHNLWHIINKIITMGMVEENIKVFSEHSEICDF